MFKRSRSRSGSPRQHKRQREIDLPHGVSEISEEDYFLKMNEFQRWLKDEKDRYFDELSGDKARQYVIDIVYAYINVNVLICIEVATSESL